VLQQQLLLLLLLLLFLLLLLLLLLLILVLCVCVQACDQVLRRRDLVLHKRDLVLWKHVGHAHARYLSKIALRGAPPAAQTWTVGGIVG
jgi:hypothetical protein